MTTVTSLNLTLYLLYVDEEWKERVRQTIPELPDERKAKYVNDLGLPEYDAHVLTLTKEMSDFFEGAIEKVQTLS